MADIEKSTGNVYTDLKVANPDEMLIKAQLASAIGGILAEKDLTQQKAAEILGLPQPKLSRLLNGRFRGISEAKMLECLSRLGRDVRIVIGQERPRRRSPGKIEVLQGA